MFINKRANKDATLSGSYLLTYLFLFNKHLNLTGSSPIDEKEARIEGRLEGLQEGLEKGLKKSVLNLYKNDFPIQQIADIMEISEDKVKSILKKNKLI